MSSPAFIKASRMLARAARRHGLALLSEDTIARTVMAAFEEVLGVTKLKGVEFRVPRATREGVASRYLVLEHGRSVIISSVGPGGWAMVASLKNIALDRNVVMIRPLGPTPLAAHAIPLDASSVTGKAYVCRARAGRVEALGRAAYALVMRRLNKAIDEVLEILMRFPAGDEGCDPLEPLKAWGWEAREGEGFMRASKTLGEGFAALLLGAALEGRWVEESTYIEACGRVVRVEARALLASGLAEVLGDCVEAGSKVEASAGRFRLAMESRRFVAACISFRGYEELPNVVPEGTLPPIACEGEVLGRSLIIVSGGDLAVKARVGSVTASIKLADPVAVALAPMPIEVAAIASPAGEVEVLSSDTLSEAVGIQDPGYRYFQRP
ncbi:MAG: hypothetical protein F7B17_05840 [Desulfurococcales archaeon]|nr:hypothetical protein [Desulfurococcales archaeon]